MAKEERDLELLRAYLIQLKVLDDQLNRDQQGVAKDPSITALLSAARSDGWFSLYEAEQRLAVLMTDDQIKAEAVRRFEEANRLGVASAPALHKQYQGTEIMAERRAVFTDLLDDVHFAYSKRRLDRSTRKKSAQLFYVSGLFVLAPLLVFLVLPFFFNITSVPNHTAQIAVVLYFGILGAYFSRIIAFQSSLDRLDYDTLVRDYSGWSLTIRLLTGLIGALLIYLLINSKLLDGTLFPETDKLSIWRSEGETILPLPSLDFSKLIIWAVIAGFSERFIPDQLTRLEPLAREKATK